LLQKEIGEDIPLDVVMDETGKWKGRAQKISILNAKVRVKKKNNDSI
jgi:hypothetical protein